MKYQNYSNCKISPEMRTIVMDEFVFHDLHTLGRRERDCEKKNAIKLQCKSGHIFYSGVIFFPTPLDGEPFLLLRGVFFLMFFPKAHISIYPPGLGGKWEICIPDANLWQAQCNLDSKELLH